MNKFAEFEIKKYFSNYKIVQRKTLSNAFLMKCEKITINNNKSFVAKYYIEDNKNFNSIISEYKSLKYLQNKFPNLFPKLRFSSDNLLLIDYVEHNNKKNDDYQKILAEKILKIHKVSNDKYGFDFDTQIGGLKQPNKYNSNWINFFRINRLNMIFEKISNKNPLPNQMNFQINILLKDLENRLPKNPKISLLHGDLWSGNILFNDGKLVSLIDPGIYFGHNELEVAYLSWFKYIDNKFFDYYSKDIKISKEYFEYEPIYQLYFSLLNIYLWSREYIKDAEKLLKKIFQTQGLGSNK